MIDFDDFDWEEEEYDFENHQYGIDAETELMKIMSDMILKDMGEDITRRLKSIKS